MSPSSSTSGPSLCFLCARPPPPSPAMCRALAPPRAASLCATCRPSPRRRSPPRAGSLPASPRRAAVAPSRHASRRLPAAAPVRPCLLLDLEHVLELPTDSLFCSHTCISIAFRFPELSTSPEPCRSLGSSSTATAAASYPRSNALAAPQQPTEAYKPAQFRSSALDRPDHSAGELELPPPLGLAVVPTICCLLTLAKHTTSTTSSRRSFPATSPPLSYPPATGTPSTSLEAPPPASVRHQPAALALLFPNTGHPCDRCELLKLFPHLPLAAGEPPRRNLISPDRLSCVARPRTQLRGFESFQGPFCRKSVPPL
jgi:hypothetical protein